MLNDSGDVFASLVSHPERHLERVERQVGGHAVHGPPADDPAREHVGYERSERHPRPRRNIGEVHYPELIRAVSSEAALNVISRP